MVGIAHMEGEIAQEHAEPPKELELSRLTAFFGLTERDRGALTHFSGRVDEVLERVYQHLDAFPEVSIFFRGAPERTAKVLAGCRAYLKLLLGAVPDESRRALLSRTGRVFDTIGLPIWMFGAFYSEVVRVISELPEWADDSWESVVKFLLLDMCLLTSEYQRSREENLQQRLTELEALNRFAAARVNELQQNREAGEMHLQRYRVLAELVCSNFDQPLPERAASAWLESLLAQLDEAYGQLWAVDTERSQLFKIVEAGLCPPGCKETMYLNLGEGLAGLAALRSEPLVVWDVAKSSDPVLESLRQVGLAFYVAVPVPSRDATMAVVCLGSVRPRAWGWEDTELVQDAARVLGRRPLEILLESARRSLGGRDTL